LRRNPNDPQDADYTGYDFWLTKLNQLSTDATNNSLAQNLVPTIGLPSLSLTKLSTGRKWSNALVTNTPGSLLRNSLRSNETPPRQTSFARFWQGKGGVPPSK